MYKMPVEERLDNHDERLAINSKHIHGHSERILQLEAAGRDTKERLEVVEEGYSELVNTVDRLDVTVTKENKETRETMREQSAKLWDLVSQAMGFQKTRTTQAHDLKMAKINVWSTVFLKIAGGVGALLATGGLIFQWVVK